jgi:hypothetical protein
MAENRQPRVGSPPPARDAADFGERVARCGACGFVPNAELSGAALAAFLA